MSLLVSLLLLALTATGLTRALTEQQAANRFSDRQRLFFAAEAGLDSGRKQVLDLVRTRVGFPSSAELAALTAPTILPGAAFGSYQITYEAPPQFVRMPDDSSFAGMNAWVAMVLIDNRANSQAFVGSSARLTQRIRIEIIPVFQFLFLDDGNLLLTPDKAMDIRGAVYANGNITVAALVGMTFHDPVSAGGSIQYILPQFIPGDVVFKNIATGQYAGMRNSDPLDPDGLTLDSTDAGWATRSVQRWGSSVKAGAPKIKMPLPSAVDPAEIIQRGQLSDTQTMRDARLYYKAGLRIEDGGLATDSQGNFVSLPAEVVTTKTFYDVRESRQVCVTEVDVQQLAASGKAPTNGILYIDRTWACPGGQMPAVRVVNGQALPTNGLTVVTPYPVYIKGDYNTVNKRPAAFMCDAFALQSSNWSDDPAYALQAGNQQVPADQTTNAAILSGGWGDTDNSQLTLQPGENTRNPFMEHWGGKRWIYRGSLVTLWKPRYAKLIIRWPWAMPGAVMDTNMDEDFLTNASSLPPGTPNVTTQASVLWQQQ